jgi:Nucleotide-diphospho-sugar transferase
MKQHLTLFQGVDILWFWDPFRHISLAVEFAIACDIFSGDPYKMDNLANSGFQYAKSCHKTIEFYKYWHQCHAQFPGSHEQYAFNAIKGKVVSQMKLRIQFLDTAYIGTFCQLSNDLNKICTLHGKRLHDLRQAFDDWKNFTAKSADEKKWGNFRWRVRGKCIH